VLVVGPTQSGKTSGLAVPAVLEWEGPVVAASVKADLLRDTRTWRQSQGPVWVFDPTRSIGPETARWSPLDASLEWRGARRVARALADVARSSSTALADGEFWYALAAKLLAPLLRAAALGGLAVADVVRWVDEQVMTEPLAILESCEEADAVRALAASMSREDRVRSSVFTTAESVMAAFEDPLVAEACNTSSGTTEIFDAGRLLDTGGTLYLCAPAHDQARLRPLFATLVGEVLERAYGRATREGAPLDPPLLVLLDEAANIAPLAALDELASTASGHGVQLVTVWQDLAQLQARYKERSGSIVNNHRAKVFLAGIADTGTLEHASILAGETEHSLRSTTSDRSGAVSTSDATTLRRLLPADALRRLPPGNGLLVYGHLPPVRTRLRPWFDDPGLRERARS
jgi:type IV secretion system protein VirD4